MIVAGIIEIAHNLGLDVVAEGIEDATALDLVRNLHSDLAQGYHLGKPAAARPVPPSDIAPEPLGKPELIGSVPIRSMGD